MFQMKTKVSAHASSLIPVHGFSFTKIIEITSHTKDHDGLVGWFIFHCFFPNSL